MMASNPEVWEKEMRRAKQEGSIDASMEFSLLPEIIALVASRKWMLFVASADATAFVTTDNPVTLTWFDQEAALYPPGLGLRNTQLIFPVSNELAAVGTFEYDARAISADEDFVAKINGNTILLRNRQVYARDSDFQYQNEAPRKTHAWAGTLRGCVRS
jgi:Protein of unknown function (DUF4238)